MGKDFLLSTPSAVRLYHEAAEGLPIIDYHNHLSPAHIAGNRPFANLWEAWLEGDHYKWRAMRCAGFSERLCTGDASPREKFNAWAATVPQTLGNPLYHWTHLELRRYFGIKKLLSPDTADEIWETANACLRENNFRARGLLEMQKVRIICTTDDPADSLSHHQAFRNSASSELQMFPAFRPDRVYNFKDLPSWERYIKKLANAAGGHIFGWESLLEALMVRHAFFHQNGCRISDHGVEYVPAREWNPETVDSIIRKALAGTAPSFEETLVFQSAVMESCARMDAAAGWAMQIHTGALRNVNPRAFSRLGPDTGFDIIGDFPQISGLARFMGTLAEDDMLPRTIIYPLNPADNEAVSALIGAFQKDLPGKIQIGSGWWFNDQKNGMERQMTALASMGLLSRFVGMLTDSRSFLSFPRHEYFRRVLCNMVGGWVENGEVPNDTELLDNMIKDICCRNAVNYFGFNKETGL